MSLAIIVLAAAPAGSVRADFPSVDCPYFCVNYADDNAECNAEGTVKRQSHMSSCRVVSQCMNTDMGQMCDAWCEGSECYDV